MRGSLAFAHPPPQVTPIEFHLALSPVTLLDQNTRGKRSLEIADNY